MTGVSIHFNILTNILKEKTYEAKLKHNNSKQVNAISVPLLFQASFPLSPVASFGLFGNYDTRARFKGENYKKLKQLMTGISFGLRI